MHRYKKTFIIKGFLEFLILLLLYQLNSFFDFQIRNRLFFIVRFLFFELFMQGLVFYEAS